MHDEDQSSDGALKGDNIQVICRVRPFSKREIDLHNEEDSNHGLPLRSILSMSGGTTTFLDPETFQEKEQFQFDHSLWSILEEESANPFATQDTVMRTIGSPALTHVWNGFNTCVFAYGQTGSGKTFTMMGTDEDPGLIPTMCQELFKSIEMRRAEELEHRPSSGGVISEFRLEARFMEIYNDRVKDLLWALRSNTDSSEGIDHENLKVRNLPSTGPVVVGLTSVVVDKWADCLQLIEEGTRNRSVAATKMNETSSRSHSIFRLKFIQTTSVISTKAFERPKSFDKVSNVCLVDLAGSERNKKTGAQGERLKEAVAINKSLTSLKNVIDALVEGRQVIPYRDSQLTFLLSDSLGGNSKTFMIACASPHRDNADETLNTLRYALRAQGIVCHATVNESDELKRMNELRQELELLRQMKEEPREEDAVLRKERQEKRDQLASIQSASAQQQETKEELQRDVAMGAALRSNARYQSSFRVMLARRLQATIRARCQRLEAAEPELAESLAERERSLRKKQSEFTVASKVEADSKVLLRAREKELDTLRAKASALEWRKRSLMKQDEQIRRAVEQKQNLRPWITFVSKLVVAARAHHHQKEFSAFVEEQNALQQNQMQESEEAESRLRVLRQSNLDDLRASIRRLEESLIAAKSEHAEGQQSYAQRIQGLHAECIFLEAEMKEAAEELEKTVASINKSRTTAFFALKEEWSAKFSRTSLEKEKDLIQLHEDKEIAYSQFEEDEKKHLADFVKASEVSLAAIEERSSSTVQTLVLAQQDDESRLDALNRESTVFLSTHRRSELRYKALYESLLKLGQSDSQRSVVYDLLFQPANKSKAIAARLSEELLLTKSFSESDTKTPQRRLPHLNGSISPQLESSPTVSTPSRKYVPASVLRTLRSKSPTVSNATTPRR